MWLKSVRVENLAGTVSAVLATVLLLAVCNNGDAAPPATPGAVQKSYVLVTRMRPASLDQFVAVPRSVYDLCVPVARRRAEAVKPFPVLPPDFVQTRTTYASDGQSEVRREEMFGLERFEGDGDATLNGCAWRLRRTLTVSVTRGGQQQESFTDADGKVTVGEPAPVRAEPVRAGLVALHTIPNTINGVQLKCTATGKCMVDPALVMVAEGYRPVMAAARMDNMPTVGTLIVEPVSLVVGKPFDPALLRLEQHK